MVHSNSSVLRRRAGGGQGSPGCNMFSMSCEIQEGYFPRSLKTHGEFKVHLGSCHAQRSGSRRSWSSCLSRRLRSLKGSGATTPRGMVRFIGLGTCWRTGAGCAK